MTFRHEYGNGKMKNIYFQVTSCGGLNVRKISSFMHFTLQNNLAN